MSIIFIDTLRGRGVRIFSRGSKMTQTKMAVVLIGSEEIETKGAARPWD